MALAFTASLSQYLKQAAALVTGYPCSFACWYKPTTTTAGYGLISVGVAGSSSISYFTLGANSGGPAVAVIGEQGTGSKNIPSVAAMSAGSWYHVVAVFSSATVFSVWLNGVQATGAATSITPTALDTTQIGAYVHSNTGPAFFVDGAIAYPTIWNIALSSGDIAALYNSGSGADPRNTEAANLQSFSLLAGSAPFPDSITTVNWTVNGSPTVVADPFSLGANSPTATVQAASSVTASSATLNGNVTNENTGGNATIWGFNYGLTSAYGQTVQFTGSFSTGAFALGILGLAPGITYHYQAFATNPGGTGFSGDQTFTTGAAAPANKGSVLYDGPQLSSGSTSSGSVANLFDGNNATTWMTSTDAAWAGIDCGAPVTLTKLVYTAQPGGRDNAFGAVLNGDLSDPTFASPTSLYTVPTNVRPSAGTLMNSVSLSLGGAAYRYYMVQTTPSLTWGFADLDFIGAWASGVYSQPVAPVITPPGGNYDQPTVVRMSTLTTSATIYYTTDGTTPTTSSKQYTGPVVVNSSAQLNAIAVDAQLSTPTSRVTTAHFFIPSVLYYGQFQYDNRNYKLSSTQGYIFQGQDGWWYQHMINVDAVTSTQLGTNTYKSADLRNWIYTGNICGLPLGSEVIGNVRVVVRGMVFYNPVTQLYVKWLDQDNYEAKGVEVWTSTSPDASGTWTLAATYTQASPMGDGNTGAGGSFYGDTAGFIDPVSGNTYVIYNWNSNADTAFSLLVPSNYTNTQSSGSATYADNREGHALCYNGQTYFWLSSAQTGNAPNLNQYATANSPIGPWSGLINPFQSVAGAPSNLTAYAGQTNQILFLPGRNAYIYIGNNYVAAASNWLYTSYLPITFPTLNTMSISWQNANLWFDGVTQYSPWSLDTVFPTISGAPLAASRLSVSAGLLATWTNNEPNPACTYLDSSGSPTFASGVVSEVLPVGSTSFQVTAQLGAFFRVRTVNVNGTSLSNIAMGGSFGGGGGAPPFAPPRRFSPVPAVKPVWSPIAKVNPVGKEIHRANIGVYKQGIKTRK